MRRRRIEEKIFTGIMAFSMAIVAGSLIYILAVIFLKGARSLSLEMIISAPKGGYYNGGEGGILNAILGTLVLGVGATFLAFLVSLPLAIYLNMYLKKNSRFAVTVRFFLDVLWGVPAIVYGAFGFTVMILLGMRASLLAGTVTVALLILPIMARSMDEVMRMIPAELLEASFSLGATRLETAMKVIFKQALPGILTAILLAFGRGIGDAAAVLFTASFTDSLPYSLFKPVATLPLAIFFQLGTPFPEVQERGYAAALLLTIIMLLISILSRYFTKKYMKNIV